LVLGIDVNEVEISQAGRLFKKDNLEFRCDSFNPKNYLAQKFDIILFAASVQYFPSIKTLLDDALSCLSPTGEIHILDSHFYRNNEIKDAARRTENYYLTLGFPEMAAYYFHHSLKSLDGFNYLVLADPHSFYNSITKKELFYWISITH
ncbi:MAG: class I SAM-dependent methyltransferase, partial [Bacteroidota bacterium]|nr:class I SAM-dependent methyltransferase [Bacteroidota bacterium]